MKRFLGKVAAIGMLVVACLVMMCLFVKVPSDDYLQAYNKKVHLLETVPSPRIIFVGGSNLAFGLDSRRIQDSLHMPVINYGLHAGIGLRYMVDDVSLYARPHDVLVFAFEYDQFYGIANGESVTLCPLMVVNRGKKLRLLGVKQWLEVIKGVPSLGKNLFPPTYNEYSYRASNFNEWGDEVKHWHLASKGVVQPAFLKNLDKGSMRYFLAKLDELESKGCRVLLVPPVCCEIVWKQNKAGIEKIVRAFRKAGRSYLAEPECHILPDSLAFDTHYHVSYEGAQIFTSRIIEELKGVL